jgi:transposase
VIGLPRSARILLFAEPTDMRKGHNGLQGLVLAAGEDPFGGDLFVFISRRRDRAKILTYDGGGLVLWYKRLEKGRFRHPKRDETNVELDATALAMLLDGIDVEHVRRPAKWEPRRPANETIDKLARV